MYYVDSVATETGTVVRFSNRILTAVLDEGHEVEEGGVVKINLDPKPIYSFRLSLHVSSNGLCTCTCIIIITVCSHVVYTLYLLLV